MDYGFRLPSAVDNRPLKFAEFERMLKQVIYVSATPGPYELDHGKGEVIEQIAFETGAISAEFGRFIASETVKWADVIKRSGTKLD